MFHKIVLDSNYIGGGPTKRLMKIAFMLNMIFAFPLWAAESSARLSPHMADELLEKSGYRWQQTMLPTAEADAKYGQADSAAKIHVNAFSREFIMRTSELILGISNSGPLDVIGGGITGVQAGYEVYNLSSRFRLEAAQLNQELGRATTEQYQNDLKFLLQLRYLTAQQYKLRSEVADRLISKDKELSLFAHKKLEAGVGIPLDLSRAEAMVERDQFKKLEAEASYQKSLYEIAELIPNFDFNCKLDALEFHELSAEAQKNILSKKDHRGELKVAELTLETTRKMKQSIDAENKLTVSAMAEIGTIGTQALGLINSPTGSLGLQITIPLYDGGYSKSRSAEILSKLNSLEWQKQQVDLDTRNQLGATSSRLEFTKQVVLSSQRQTDLARKSLEYAERKIRIGSAGNLDLITAQNDLALAMDLYVQAIYGYEATKLQFFHLISDLDGYLTSVSSSGGSNE